jgi:hypothetical protein
MSAKVTKVYISTKPAWEMMKIIYFTCPYPILNKFLISEIAGFGFREE